MERGVISREELLDSYARPYRRWLPVALAGYGVHYLAGLTALVAAIALLGTIVDAGWADAALTVALFGAFAIVVVSVWALGQGVRIIRDRTWEWRDHRGELAGVRPRRPHAIDADPEVAHAEYAVAVSDHGDLVTFEFVPLAAHEEASKDAILITGTPRYEARPVLRAPFDSDAEVASEQLVAAQEHAAGLEREEIARARRRLDLDTAARELALETRSTGDALRGVTGQDRR